MKNKDRAKKMSFRVTSLKLIFLCSVFILFFSYSVLGELFINFDNHVNTSSITGTQYNNNLVFNLYPALSDLPTYAYDYAPITSVYGYLSDSSGANCIEDFSSNSVNGRPSLYGDKYNWLLSDFDTKVGCTKTWVKHVLKLNQTYVVGGNFSVTTNFNSYNIESPNAFVYELVSSVNNESVGNCSTLPAGGSGSGELSCSAGYYDTGAVFDRLEIKTFQGTSKTQRIVNISIDEVGAVAGNQLPIVDFNILNNDQCFNESGNEFDLNITATDPEGDTIYYATQISDYLRRFMLSEETFSLSDNRGDFDFFTRGNFYSNGTTAPDNSASLNFYDMTLGADGFNILLRTKTYVDVWGYNLQYPISDTGTHSYDIYFVDQDTQVSNILKNVVTDLYNITYIHDGTNVTIYLNETKAHSYQSSLYDGSDTANYLNTVILVNPQNNSMTFVFTSKNTQYTQTDTFNYSGLQTTEFYSVATANEFDFYLIDNLYFRGWNFRPSPSFSTTKPTTETFDDKGSYTVELYVTDTIHLPFDEYDTYTANVFISFEQECGINTEDVVTGEIKESLTGMKGVFLALSNVMADMTHMNVDFWIFVFALLYMLICIAGAFIVYFLTFNNSTWGNMAFWFFQVFGNLFLVYPDWWQFLGVVMLTLSVVIWFFMWLTQRNINTGG